MYIAGDNANGGERYLCGVHDQPFQSAATKASHFTCMGVTSLTGEPVMCVVIITGKTRDLAVETGVNWNLLGEMDDTYIDTTEDYAFFNEHFGKDNLLPGGPTCTFKGKEVPAFVTFTESGGIDGPTLTAIFRCLDALGLYSEDRDNGLIPFALLDGHQSCFDLEFLTYINDANTRWNVCIGVPYGTALWQVGDSSEQNGSFKMALTAEKKRLFEDRLNCYQHDLHLIRTDILPIVNKSWCEGFTNVASNLKAGSCRGWYPYNFSLLLHPVLRATMTEDMIRWERDSGLFPTKYVEEGMNLCYVEEEFGKVSLKTVSHSQLKSTSMNFDGGAMAQHVANSVIGEVDKQKARELITKRKREGDVKRSRIMKIRKRLTAGKLVLEGGSHHLDVDVLDHVRRRRQEVEDAAISRQRKVDLEYLKQCYFADKILASYGHTKVELWKRKEDIVTYIKPLKRPGDSALPTSRSAAEQRFHEWIGRHRRVLDADSEVMEIYEKWLKEQEGGDAKDSKK